MRFAAPARGAFRAGKPRGPGRGIAPWRLRARLVTARCQRGSGSCARKWLRGCPRDGFELPRNGFAPPRPAIGRCCRDLRTLLGGMPDRLHHCSSCSSAAAAAQAGTRRPAAQLGVDQLRRSADSADPRWPAGPFTPGAKAAIPALRQLSLTSLADLPVESIEPFATEAALVQASPPEHPHHAACAVRAERGSSSTATRTCQQRLLLPRREAAIAGYSVPYRMLPALASRRAACLRPPSMLRHFTGCSAHERPAPRTGAARGVRCYRHRPRRWTCAGACGCTRRVDGSTLLSKVFAPWGACSFRAWTYSTCPPSSTMRSGGADRAPALVPVACVHATQGIAPAPSRRWCS